MGSDSKTINRRVGSQMVVSGWREDITERAMK